MVKSEYQPEKEEVKAEFPKGMLRESDTRMIIDRKLREAGWDIEDKNQIATEEPIKSGRIDYLLKDRRGRSIGILEAKRFSIDPTLGKQQALEYAKDLSVDFIFLSNGDDIYFWDYKQRPEQKIPAFFSQRDLERLLALRLEKKPLSVIPIPDKVFLQGEEKIIRPYQKEALQAMDEAIEKGKRKMLLVMATGTGKTLVMAMQIKRMLEAGLIERVLFLVDRIELGIQAQETFDEYLKDYPTVLLYGGRRKREAQIVIATLPTIYSQLDTLTSGAFDLIVSDEAHRSVYHVYNAVLTHFDAIRIGLTATPSMFIDRNTYRLFGCWDERNQRGIPTYKYGICRGVDERYLAGYDIYRAMTKVSLEGIKYEGEDYNPEDLERKINVPARNKAIVAEFKAEEEKQESNRPKKTIVYAITQNHAAQITRYLNEVYPEYNGRYAETITSNIPDADRAIRRFKHESLPIVAVSVGMLDTGFDAPAVENIVMVRPTKSPILYQQMRGRGSRLCPRIDKTSFRLYDFAGNTNPDRFNDPGYNPYAKFAKDPPGLPWGVEEEEISEKERLRIKREFVQVPEEAPENVDLIVKREYVEIGPEGERIDVDDYQNRWRSEISRLIESEPLIAKIKNDQELTNEELLELSRKLNSSRFYFNETNLRSAYHYPQGTILEFIKAAFDLYKLPTEEQMRENKINNLFESWLVDKNLGSEQVKILRMVKSQYLANREKIDISIFNQPLFARFGGLKSALRIFGEEELQSVVNELNRSIFINSIKEANNYGSQSLTT